jgi:hypothetical protein
MQPFGGEVVAGPRKTPDARGEDVPVGRHPIGASSHDRTNIRSIFSERKLIRAAGDFQLSFFFGGPVTVKADSQVLVSITEVSQGEGSAPFLGEATMSIANVVPQDDGTVWVRGHVEHPEQLLCMLNFVIVN